MASRQHHYLSQCYLRGFTRNGSKNSKLAVFDALTSRRFDTSTRNVGGIRDFNRVDIDGVDVEVLEKTLSAFETKAADALRSINAGKPFDGDGRSTILNLVALLAVRSPERREWMRAFHASVVERIMEVALRSPERWARELQKYEESTGITLVGDTSYEAMKDFFDQKRYEIAVARGYQIGREMQMVEAVLPYVFARSWSLVRTTSETGPFITSDNPVGLYWLEPQLVPPLFRDSPGHGQRSTRLVFPMSKDTALVGEFDRIAGDYTANLQVVAAINRQTIQRSYRQIYAPHFRFLYLSNEDAVRDGNHLVAGLAR